MKTKTKASITMTPLRAFIEKNHKAIDDVLRLAATRVKRDGLGKGNFLSTRTGQCCTMGALHVAARQSLLGMKPPRKIGGGDQGLAYPLYASGTPRRSKARAAVTVAEAAVAAAWDMAYPDRIAIRRAKGSATDIASMNDAPSTTPADVVNVLGVARRLLRAYIERDALVVRKHGRGRCEKRELFFNWEVKERFNAEIRRPGVGGVFSACGVSIDNTHPI